MRVLLYGLNFAPEPTGIGKYTGELAEALCGAGHEVRVVTALPYYPGWRIWKQYRGFGYRTERASPALKVFRCPLWVPSRPTGWARLIHLFSFALSSLPVVLWQRLWRPEAVIVVVPTMFCLPGTLLALLGSRAKRIVHVQDLEVDAAFELGLVRGRTLRSLVIRIERGLLNRFDVVSSISVKMLERLAQKGVVEDKLVLLPNWIHTQEIKPGSKMTSFRFDWGLEQDCVVALYSGSMGEKQGVEVLMEAAARLEKNASIRFVICSEGPAFERVKTQYGHLSNVIWNGLVPQEKLNDLLNTADIHLLPQRGGASDLVMPSKLTGMLAGGRPVVATAVPGTQIADIVGNLGIVVLPEDPAALAAAIEQLANDQTLREQLGAAARAYAVENLSGNVILSRFERQLRELVNPA